MSSIYELMSIFVEFPFLVAIPAVIFFVLYLKGWGRTIFAAAIVWGLYTLYESAIILGFFCSGDCNIRVDLLVIYPVLLGLSILALIMIAVRAK